jgi:hypothetical protein
VTFSPKVNLAVRPFVLLCVSPTSAPLPYPGSLLLSRGRGLFLKCSTASSSSSEREAGHARSPFLRWLALLAYVCLLAQCTLPQHAYQVSPLPQVQENTQAQTLTPEERPVNLKLRRARTSDELARDRAPRRLPALPYEELPD